jgi:hypothetical protein
MTNANPTASATPPPSVQAALAQELAIVARLHAERLADPRLAATLERLSAWQARRLAQTYADLASQPRYAAAIEFFLSDLYGGKDFTQRDTDLARVLPVMTRMLPESVIVTVAEAVALNRLSQELDRALLVHLPEGNEFTVADYANAYRRAGNRAGRERQIRLIGEIGAALDHFVGIPLIHTALRMMRHPARLAGFSVLHQFLEHGFEAFRAMGGAEVFLTTIDSRERRVMEALFAGGVAPFPDPLSGSPRQP